MADKKIWSILVHLSMNMWSKKYPTVAENFDEEIWDYIVEESEKTGINMIVLDVGDAVQYSSHPEISLPDAWTRKRVHEEIKRCREKGITLIPKLNFAAPHDVWLGEYERMVSTSIYYRVCNDLIKEIYEIFEHPEYIHLGFDEEEAAMRAGSGQLVICRQGELFWHDLRYLMDSVIETGAKPWIWSCPLFNHPEEFKKHIDPDEVVLSPWYYNAFNLDHWTPVESRAEYVAYYNEGKYAEMGIKFVEEDPFLVRFREVALPLMKEGYNYVPCASVFNRCDWNTHDLLEYFKVNAPDNQVLGYMTAPWYRTKPEFKPYFEESFKFLKEAKEKFYK